MAKKKRTEESTVSPHLDIEIAKDISKFTHDPLRYVMYAYPWGTGALANYSGPEQWQKDTLNVIRDSLRKNPFNPIRIARSSGHGVGKFSEYSEHIYTTNGITTIKNLQVGDYVFGSDGKPTRVTGIPYEGTRPCYRVIFDDGSSTVCGAEHLWNVRGRNSRRTGKMTWETLETQEILRRGVKRSNGSQANTVSGGAKQWEVPQQGAVEFTKTYVPLHPYILGAWLGDGSRNFIVKPYPEFQDRLLSLWPDAEVKEPDNHCSYVNLRGLSFKLKEIGIYGKRSWEKFVPDNYKFNAIEIRSEVLRGLLDTDGTVGKNNNSIEFASASKQLTEDVIWLVRSLGGKAMMKPTVKIGKYRKTDGELKICRDSYRCTIRMPEGFNLFYIKHKAERVKPCEVRYLTRWIESIEPVGEMSGKCISVEAEDGLYQVNDFIVTHNSALVAWVIEWALATCPNSRVMVTANTAQQLMTKTWPELSVWHNRSILGHWFNFTNTTMNYSLVKGYEKTWRADAVTWSISNTEAFAGLHNRGNRIVIIIDEASAVIDNIWEVIEGALTDAETEILWLVFGNPTRNTGRFRECFRRYKHLWDAARVDSRSVNVTNKALHKMWADTYGEDSDFFRIRVTGEFPNQASGQLIASDLVLDAMNRQYKYDEITQGKPKIFGIDIAREGGDASVVWMRQGLYTRRLFKERNINTTVLTSKLVQLMDKHKPDRVFLDKGNVGAAIYDNLIGYGYRNVTAVDFAGSPDDGRVYLNKRIEMWDRIRIWLEDGGMLPKNCEESNDIEQDLISPEFFYNGKGLKVLESKKDMKERGLQSPDDGDALCLTFASNIKLAKPGADPRTMLGAKQIPMANSTWDPFSDLSL